MKYHMDDPPVLKVSNKRLFILTNIICVLSRNRALQNLNASIEPGWKIGLVGRIDAGKSSLISALFRLFNEGLEGEIKIDGRDTSTMDLSKLRCKISIIPINHYTETCALF